MKIIIIMLASLVLCSVSGIAQTIEESDTTQINYYIAAAGEFGGINEGLLIFKSNNELKIKCIKYNVSSYGKPLKADAIICFYKENKNNYSVMKPEWVLTRQQQDYLNGILYEIFNHHTSRGFSNAPEHYVVFTKKKDFVLIDSTGQWNKYLEISKVLGIKQGKRKIR